MQIPPDMLKCVAFACYQTRVRARQGSEGTIFFLSVEEDGRTFWYAVTAAHVIETIHKRPGGDGKVYLRLNLSSGRGTEMFSTEYADWIRHSDPGNDVAVYRWSISDEFDHAAWPITAQLIDDVAEGFHIGPGDNVVFLGLFSELSGHERNIPIVRAGNIAAKCKEPVWLKDVDAFIGESFLIEARSTGGISGAPVFVHLGQMRLLTEEQQSRVVTFRGIPIYWMGMIHGHYDVRSRAGRRGRHPINMGIALVVPHERIVDVVRSAEEVAWRKGVARASKETGRRVRYTSPRI